MKKYILKGVCLIVLLIVADFAVGKIFSFLHRKAFERSPSTMVTEYAMYRVDADVIIVGSSRACHHYVSEILADSLKMSVYNCGKDGAFFLYQCCVMDGILKHTHPQLIVWNLEPACLVRDPFADRHLNDLNPFYEENNFCREVINCSAPAEKYKMLFRSYRYNSCLLGYLHKSILPYAKSESGYVSIANEGYRYPTLMKGNKMGDMNEELKNYLDVMVDKCKYNGVNLLFSFSPCLTEDNYAESKSYQYLCRIAKQKNIPLIDFYHHPVFMADSTLFKDNIHLNDRGARLFTSFLCRKIKELSKRGK